MLKLDSDSSSYVELTELVVLDDLSDVISDIQAQIYGRKRTVKELEKRLAKVKKHINAIRIEY